MCRPVEVRVAGRRSTSGGRAAGSGCADRARRRRPRRPRRRWRRARPAARRPTGPTRAARSRARRSGSRSRAAGGRRWRASPGASTCRRPSPARRRPAPTSRGRSRSRRRPRGRSPSRPASARSPAPRRSRRRCRRRRCARSARRAGGRATSVSTGWRDSAANVSGPTNRRRGRRQHHDDVGALGAQEPEQLDGLVGGDRAGDAEPDQAALEAAGRVPSAASVIAQRPSSSGFAAADLGVEDREALEGQVGVDDVDAVERRAPTAPPTGRRSGSPGRRRGATPVASASSRADPGEEARRRAPGSRGPCRDWIALTVSRPIARSGRPQLDPRQLRGPRGERLEPELEPRRDRAADERAVRADAVERRRRPEVDDDRPGCRGGGRPRAR